MTISVRAQDIRDRRLEGLIGQPFTASHLNRVDTILNSSPQASQVTDLTVDSNVADTTYSWTLNGVAMSITSGSGSPTLTEIAQQIIDAINQEPLVRGQVSAALQGSDTARLTGTNAGVAFTLTESDSNLSTSAVTTAAEAAALPFGRLTIQTAWSSSELDRLAALAASSGLTAQVDVVTIAFVASVEYTFGVRIDGQTYEVQSTADTNQGTTIANIVAALEAVLPANTVAVTAQATTATFTAEVAGKEFEVYWGTSDDGASHPAISKTTNKGVGTSLAQSAFGISMHAYDEEITTVAGTSAEYPANASARVLRKGTIWVENSQGVSFGDPVYVEMGVPADNGKFFNTASSTRILLDKSVARWEKASETSTDGLALLAIDFS